MSQLIYCTWGGYQHDLAENWFRFESRLRHSPIGRLQSIITRVTLWGVKKASSQAALTTALAELESAYSTSNKDFRVLLEDGTPTQHKLLSSGSLSGVQVKDFSYIDRDPRHGQSGTEYVNQRTYRVVMEAEGVATNAFSILFWNEELTGIGTGGGLFILKTALFGPPQRQDLVQQTPSVVIQQGRALGYLGHPNPPQPKFPTHEHLERRRIMYGTPREYGLRQNTLFPISWYYEFESPTLLSGLPTNF